MKKLFIAAIVSLPFIAPASATHIHDVIRLNIHDGVRKVQCHVNRTEFLGAVASRDMDETGTEIVNATCINTIKEAFDDGFVDFWRNELAN